MKYSIPILTACGVVVLHLSFLAAWSDAGEASGAPGLGLAVASILLTAAAVASLGAWVTRNAKLPPADQKCGLGIASFCLFGTTLGALFVGLVTIVAQPDNPYSPYGNTGDRYRALRTVSDFHEAVAVGAFVLAGLAFVVAWIVGRAALAGSRDDEATLTGWSRTSAAIAPFVGSLALALFTLGTPAAIAGVLAAESELGDRADHTGEAALFAAAALALLALLLGIAALITRGKPGFLRVIFAPLTARLEARHAKGLLIATEVAAGLAAVAVAIYFAVE